MTSLRKSLNIFFDLSSSTHGTDGQTDERSSGAIVLVRSVALVSHGLDLQTCIDRVLHGDGLDVLAGRPLIPTRRGKQARHYLEHV